MSNSEKEEEVVKPTTTKWRCPECKRKFTLYLTPSEPPQCSNPEVHKNKYFKMVQL
jgi:transposase-like protein